MPFKSPPSLRRIGVFAQECRFVVVFESRETLFDDLHGIAIHDLVETLRLIVEVFERLAEVRKRVQKVMIPAQGAAGIVGKYEVTTHR